MSAPKKAGDLIALLEAARTRQPASRVAEPDAPAKSKAKVVQLPPWPEAMQAIPNHLARSSLFAPIARGRRKLLDAVEIPSRGDVKLLYTGHQLDEADCDVWMQLLHEARRVPLGEKVMINRAAFLRAIGRSTGTKDYQWLHESIGRLGIAALYMEAKRYTIGKTPRSSLLHLVKGFDHDPDTGTYVLEMDQRLVLLFGNREFAQIDRDKRLQIEHHVDMAKSLQRLVATSSDRVQRHSLVDLKERMRYASPMRKFRDALMDALRELERLKIIAKARIERSTRGVEQATWTRLGPFEPGSDDAAQPSG